jgi:hypothetical protein
MGTKYDVHLDSLRTTDISQVVTPGVRNLSPSEDAVNTAITNAISGISSGGIVTVANYSALPAANTVNGKFYWCQASQGTSWLPGYLGGTYYNAGLYHSNGTTWEWQEYAYQATQVEVDAGLVTDKFVTPATLAVVLSATTSAYQPLDSDLTVIAAIVPADDDIIQRKAGSWVKRTITQFVDDIKNTPVVFGNKSISLTDNIITGEMLEFNTACTDGNFAFESDLLTKADIASPTFTGVPAGPTAAPGTNTTQLATTEFVLANAGGVTSYISGTALLNFGNEEDGVVVTIADIVITSTTVMSITFLPQETTETSLDDFKLNGVTFNLENIIDNTSFDIRGTASNDASGNYTVKYIIQLL